MFILAATTGGHKNNMDLAQPLRNLRWSLLLAGVFVLPAGAAEPAAVDVPPYPATLDGACADASCPDTLHADHEVTFISRSSFPAGNALLTRDAKHELQRMLAELESFAAIEHIEIVGHADPSGPENYNRWLSELRAERVRDYFAQSGVDPRRMATRGAGSREPLPGTTNAAAQRRIEIRIALRPFL